MIYILQQAKAKAGCITIATSVRSPAACCRGERNLMPALHVEARRQRLEVDGDGANFSGWRPEIVSTRLKNVRPHPTGRNGASFFRSNDDGKREASSGLGS